MAERTLDDLRQKQALPLPIKIRLTQERIRQWVNEFGEDGVYISFSGGKDSTVLLDIVRNKCGYKDIPAVFVDVPTQYPELKEFVKTFDNIEILKPKISFAKVCEQYGFPLISKEVAQKYSDMYSAHDRGRPSYADKQFDGTYVSKNGNNNMISVVQWAFLREAKFRISDRCCKVMKKEPVHNYCKRTGRHPITAQMAAESFLRTQHWLRNGCNAFDLKIPVSNPMMFWLENDILQYIYENNIQICSVYGEVTKDTDCDGQMDISDFLGCEMQQQYKTTGCKRTGCALCAFGAHLDKPGEERYLMLKSTHPKMYALLDVMKNNGVTFREAIEWTNEHGGTNIRL